MTITLPGRKRPRRTRRTAALRDLVAETRVRADALVMPHFVLPGEHGEEPIASMPGISRLGRAELLTQIESDLALGIRTVLLFGVPGPESKGPDAAAAADPQAPVARAVRQVKAAFGDDLTVVTDVCLCAYTDHGHCGLLTADGHVDNDSSLAPLAAMAASHAEAGADLVAPSDMMDGRVAAIRDTLDQRGLTETAILSYSAKFASAYYGPFRDAAASAPGQGDRCSYQMDPRNVDEAIREALLDEEEGADLLMVKPALAYLDVIARVRAATRLPLVAYNVSGEYSAVKAAAAAGWLDERRIVTENLHAICRAGADIVITYHARDAIAGGWI